MEAVREGDGFISGTYFLALPSFALCPPSLLSISAISGRREAGGRGGGGGFPLTCLSLQTISRSTSKTASRFSLKISTAFSERRGGEEERENEREKERGLAECFLPHLPLTPRGSPPAPPSHPIPLVLSLMTRFSSHLGALIEHLLGWRAMGDVVPTKSREGERKERGREGEREVTR